MDADEIVIHRMKRNRGSMVLDFFEDAFVNRMNRRMCIRIVRLLRSTYDVLMCFGSGAPSVISLHRCICPQGAWDACQSLLFPKDRRAHLIDLPTEEIINA